MSHMESLVKCSEEHRGAIMQNMRKEKGMAWIFFLAVFFLLSPCTENEVVPPESMSVMLGEEATFFCAGESLVIFWTIDNTSIDFLGIEDTVETVDGVPRSIVTISGSVENDNISIQCSLLVDYSSPPLHLPPVFLTVLGIGPVPSLTLVNSSCIQWEEPAFKSADVTDLMYNVKLSGADLSPLTITTNKTQYCTEPVLTPCEEYTITVTPFSTSPDYNGISSTTTDIAPGDNYHLEGNCTVAEVGFANTNSVTCSFFCQVTRPIIACPLQCLHVVTTIVPNSDADYNSSMFPMNSSLFLDDKTFVVVNVTGLPARTQYYSDFSILDKDGGVVDNGSTSFFTTFSVQNASFSHPTNSSSIGVTCTFAFNASASACFVLFENPSLGLDFNGSVHNSFSSLWSSGVVDIPQNILEQGVVQGLSTVTFDAKIYDMYMNGEITKIPAFEQGGALEVELHAGKPNPDMSTHIIRTSTSIFPSASSPEEQHHKFQVWTVIAAVLSLVVVVVVLCLFLGTSYFLYKTKCLRKLSTVSGVQYETRIDTSTALPMATTEDSSVVVTLDNCVTIKPSQTKPASGDSHYAELGPRPVDAPPILPELDGQKVVYSDIKKHTMEYAVLGDRPANAPLVLPPDPSVVYSDVQSAAKHTNLHGSTTSVIMEETISASSVDMCTPKKWDQEREDRTDTSEPWEQKAEVDHGLEAQGIPVYGKQNVITSIDGSSSAHRSIGPAGQDFSVMIFPDMSTEVSEPTLCSSCDAENTLPSLVFPNCSVPSFVYKSESKIGNCFDSVEQDENEPCLTIESQSQEIDCEKGGKLIIMDEHHEEEQLQHMTSENHCQEDKWIKAVKSVVEPNPEVKSIKSPCSSLCVPENQMLFACISVWFLLSCSVSTIFDPGIDLQIVSYLY